MLVKVFAIICTTMILESVLTYRSYNDINATNSLRHIYSSIKNNYSQNIPLNYNKRKVIATNGVFFDQLNDQLENKKHIYLHLQKCQDLGEAYAAAYLVTKEHFLQQDTNRNLSRVNCEAAFFLMVSSWSSQENTEPNGVILQTIDLLDYSVINLSGFERLQRQYLKHFRKNEITLESIRIASEQIMKISHIARDTHDNKQNSTSLNSLSELNKTVVIMPFLLYSIGSGYSKTINRKMYLNASFWSVYMYIPNIVVCVCSKEDYDWIMTSSNLPFYEVILINNLPKTAALPVATVQYAKERIRQRIWYFDYIFYTESDQVLLLRHPETLFNHLQLYPRRVMVPHRLNPYPSQIITDVLKKKLSIYNSTAWMTMNCCMTRQNGLYSMKRREWENIRSKNVPILQIYGLQIPLGNSNFHKESYRFCQLYDSKHSNYTCP